jgi:hypothetical protein
MNVFVESVLEIRQHTFDGFKVRINDQAGLTQLSFPFSRFFGQNMRGECLVPADFPGAGCLEPLGSTPVGFHLGHDCTLLVCTGLYPAMIS